jgi:2-keto-4-pentenoate hydratase/2-oxohepta-3-ene-1,7-dioic acid hydratase in catechol pathway
MKLLTFIPSGSAASSRFGASLGDNVVDLSAAHARYGNGGAFPHSLKALIESAGALVSAERALDAAANHARAGDGVRFRREEIRLLAPIPNPGKFLCVGATAKSRIESPARNQNSQEVSREPTGFLKLNSVIVGDEAEIELPDGITTLDCEPRLVFVIGKRAFGTRNADAMRHVMGITVANDLTARQIEERDIASGTRFLTAKNMPGFGPVGPFMITLDEVPDPHNLWLTCTVNGEVRTRVHTGAFIFRIGNVIEHFSRWMPLEVGDMIALGAPVAPTPPSAVPLYLKVGDVIKSAFDGLPPLRTHVVAPAIAAP